MAGAEIAYDEIRENDEFLYLQRPVSLQAQLQDWEVRPSKAVLDDVTADPFSNAMLWIRGILEIVLDDGVSGGMNETEYEILEKIARIVTQEGGMEVNPRVG